MKIFIISSSYIIQAVLKIYVLGPNNVLNPKDLYSLFGAPYNYNMYFSYNIYYRRRNKSKKLVVTSQ